MKRILCICMCKTNSWRWRWLAWWGRMCPPRPTTVWVGWCTCTTAPSCSHGPSSRSAPPQTCRAWCYRWKGGWSSCGPLLFWPEPARPWQEHKHTRAHTHTYIHTHMRRLNGHKQYKQMLWFSLKISALFQPLSDGYKVPQVEPPLLQILFDSARCSSAGHVSIYAGWTALCTYSKVNTEPENWKEADREVTAAGWGKTVFTSLVWSVATIVSLIQWVVHYGVIKAVFLKGEKGCKICSYNSFHFTHHLAGSALWTGISSHPHPRQIHSPGWCELHMGVKKSCHLGGGDLPAFDPGPDQPLSLLVPDDLHQARVALVHVLLQRPFQLLCSPTHKVYTRHKTTDMLLLNYIKLDSVFPTQVHFGSLASCGFAASCSIQLSMTGL